MAAGALVGENQLQRIIRDLCEAVIELVKEYRETGEPITDDSTNLHKLSYKLEYLLQFDQKEKTTLLGTRKDYWDFFCDCLAKIKGANDGIRFVKSISELKTSLGKGRAFIRYSLVHQRLADTLQQCLMNQRATSDWYYARSPLLKPHLSVDIISHLYELNEVQFDVASRGHDLDASWPTFSRRTLGTPNSPGHMWKPPSRSSSINSLASSYSQQAHELPSSPDYGQGLLSELDESLASCGDDASAVDNLRLELDQSELRQQGLLSRVQQLGEESGELRRVVAELQRQLDVSLAAQEDHLGLQVALKALEGREQTLSRELEALRSGERAREAEQYLLQDKLAVAEGKNMELLAKLDGVLNEKGLQATSHFDSAQKIHELLDRLKEAESGKMEAVSDMEDKKRQVERLEEEIKVKDEALKEVSKLQRKLEEENQRAQADEETSQQSTLVLKETLETEVNALKELLKIKDMELTSSNQTLQRLESEKDSLTLERDRLVIGNCELETSVKDHTKKIDEYKTQCTSLMELNNKLLSTVKRDEELKKKMVADRVSLVAEVASLTAADKQLRGQLDDTKVAVDEKEKTLRDEIAMAAQVSETTSKRLEQESQALREDRDTMCASLSSIQAELSSSNGQVSELEKSLEMSRQNEAGLQEQVRAMEAQLPSKERDFKELQTKVKKMENREKELKKAKAKAEAAFAKQSEVIERLSTEKQAVEESQLEGSSLHAREKQEAVDKLVLVEGQLEVNMKDVSRLQAEVLDLRVQLQRAGEENLKCETKLEVTESQRAEFMSLTEQLQAQTEALNQSHVAELLNCKQKEEVLIEEQARQAAVHAELSASLAAAQQELAALKAENERLVLENGETREGVHRANTEMAELGMTICRLTAEKEEARERWTKEAAKIEELQDGATREVERLEACLAALRQENTSLREGLTQVENLPQAVVELQEQLGKAVGEVQTLQCASKEEMDAVRFQISSESMSHQNQLMSVNEELTTVKAQLHSELETVSRLKAKVSELEAVNEQYQPLMVEKDSHITKCEATLRHNEGEIQQLRDLVSRTEDALSALGTTSEELKERLEKTEAEKQSDHQRMSAEIDDLSVIKSTLEERLIELLRDKDALWQKSDALEFEQKLRAEERWWLVDKEATQCLDCKGHFTWYLRRHHCRLCGHIFCYYCSNNFVATKHSGKKERCCRECYTQHSDVVERFTQAEVEPAEATAPPAGPGPESHPQPAPYKPTPRVTVSEPGPRAEEGAFDIITEEEVNGVYDSDTVSQTTGGSPESDQGRRPPGPVDIGTGDGAQDDPEDHVTTLQDSEVNLLRSGEVSVAVAHSIDDICHFGDGSRELSIKASCYSLISIAVVDPGPSVGWVFSSEPKSISFSVVYREGPDTPVEQAKVLIPLTRCNSHRETIQGKLKVRHPGLYTLVFDNSFSRFIAKKVLYHLTLEKPVVYDGSDFP